MSTVNVAQLVPSPRLESPSETVSGTVRRGLGVDRGTLAAVLVLLLVSLSAVADAIASGSVAFERDTTDFYWPLMQWVAQQLKAGRLPLWTPQIFAGYPIFADGEIGLSYPPALLALALLPSEAAFILLRLLGLFTAAVGTFFLARVWRRSRHAALLAGIVVSQGSFFAAQIHHENVVRTAAWLPLAVACAELALRSTGHRRFTWCGAAAATLGISGLGLHPQILLEELLLLAGYGGLRILLGPPADGPRRPWQQRFRAASAVFPLIAGVGLGIAAVQLVPLFELAGRSARGAGLSLSDAEAYSLTVPGLLQVLLPFLFRGPSEQQWGLWTHWESYLYVGIAPLALALLGAWRARTGERSIWLILGAVGLLISLGQYSPVPVHEWLWRIPGLGALRAPGRFTLVVVLALAMLSAIGLDWLTSTPPARRASVSGLVLWLAPVGAFVVVLVLAHALLDRAPDSARALIQGSYLTLARDSFPITADDVYRGLLWATDVLGNPHTRATAMLMLAVGAMFWGSRASGMRVLVQWPGWRPLLVGLAALDLVAFGYGIHPRAPLSALGMVDSSVQAVLSRVGQAPPEGFRVSVSSVLPQVSPDRLAPVGIQDIQGYSSLEPRQLSQYLNRVERVDDQLLDLAGARFRFEPARYGALPSYKGVQFWAESPILSGMTGALGDQTFALDPTRRITQLRAVSALEGATNVPQDTAVASLTLRDAQGAALESRNLRAGRDTMDWGWDLPSIRPAVMHRRVEVAGQTVSGRPGQETRLLSFGALQLERPAQATTLEIRSLVPEVRLLVLGVGVVDDRGTVQQLFGVTKSKYSRLHENQSITVFENAAAFPRAFRVGTVRSTVEPQSALEVMLGDGFNPATEAVVEPAAGQPPIHLASPSTAAAGTAAIVAYENERVAVSTDGTAPALLVVGDRIAPGWEATVDGVPTQIYRTDSAFRGVLVAAGPHTVMFTFRPMSIPIGLGISSAALLLCGLLVTWGPIRRKAPRQAG